VGGPIIGNDGSVHIPTVKRDATQQWAVGIQSLAARELKPAQQTASDASFPVESLNSSDFINVAAPAVFPYKDREVVVSVCSTSRLCILEPGLAGLAGLGGLGGLASFNPGSRTSPVVQPASGASNAIERGIWGSLSSWQDADGTRWILAPVTGPLHSDLKLPVTNGPTPNGSIVAFKVQDQDGKATLSPAWVSRDLASPLPPVIANGVVFALSAGEFTRQIKTSDGITTVDEHPKGSTRATLYAFDAQTGKELWSSKNLVPVPASLTGLTVANGRVYFGGIDGTLYAFGMYMER
jgi:hypothetical protein